MSRKSTALVSFVSLPVRAWAGAGGGLPTNGIANLNLLSFSNQQCFETRWGFTLVIYNNKIVVLQLFLQPFLLIDVLQL